jgi:hypothetical protein
LTHLKIFSPVAAAPVEIVESAQTTSAAAAVLDGV